VRAMAKEGRGKAAVSGCLLGESYEGASTLMSLWLTLLAWRKRTPSMRLRK
jgi:hypothetical protein